MAATLQWYQTNGSIPGTDTPQSQTTGINTFDFKSTDTPGPAIAGEEITAGFFSQHVYTKIRFTGSFGSITDVKFYASSIDVSGYGEGAYILGSGVISASYSPGSNSMSGTWLPIGSGLVDGLDLSTTDLYEGTPGFTDYAALQLKTTTSGAVADYGGYTSFTVVYSEI